MGNITYDIFEHILDYLHDDRLTLYNCSLVKRAFRDAVAKVLYEQVTFSPAFTPVLNLRKRAEFMEGVIASASLPHNAAHVLKFEIGGYLTYRPPFAITFPAELRAALRCWCNLNTIIVAPKQHHEDLLNDILPLLPEVPKLHALSINSSYAQEVHTQILVQVGQLEALTIQNPSRAVLSLLPEWLGRMSRTLRELHLKENCGSVTPGVLRSFVPHLEAIHAFSLGLSYSLTDDDVFSFLNQLPNLRTLELRYYLQLRAPSALPFLPHLRSLTVQQTTVTNKEHVTYLCKWIRRVIARSPLVSLYLISQDVDRGACAAYDGILEHLYSKHAATLRVLRMDMAFVGRKALRQLFAYCTNLEEVALATSNNALLEIPRLIRPLLALHTLSVETRNVKPSQVNMNLTRAQEFFSGGTLGMRRLTVNGCCWEVSTSIQ
ncbi:hypothetical protein BKA93DRAFT_816002 [Sparassis latifolia]